MLWRPQLEDSADFFPSSEEEKSELGRDEEIIAEAECPNGVPGMKSRREMDEDQYLEYGVRMRKERDEALAKVEELSDSRKNKRLLQIAAQIPRLKSERTGAFKARDAAERSLIAAVNGENGQGRG